MMSYRVSLPDLNIIMNYKIIKALEQLIEDLRAIDYRLKEVCNPVSEVYIGSILSLGSYCS